MGAALEVTAPDHLTFEIGKKATLPCTFKVPPPLDMKYLAVFWQFDKKEILRYDNKGFRKPTDPELLFKEEDVEKGDISLHIDKVTVMDGGTYTCRVIYSPTYHHKDIEISVYAPPTISSLETLDSDDGSKEVVCGVTGFYPPNVTVTLLIDGKVRSDSELTQQQTNSDGTHNVTRAMTLNLEEKPRRLECRVQHGSLLQPLQKELNLQYEGDKSNTVIIAVIVAAVILIICVIVFVMFYRKKKGLTLSEIQGPKSWEEGQKLTLYCTASDCDPHTEVEWTIRDKDGNIAKISEDPSQDKEEEQPLMARAYQVKNEKKDKKGKKSIRDLSSTLTFIPTLSHLNSIVTCEVKRGKKTELKTFKPEKLYAKPQFLEPAEFTICSPGEVQLGVNLRRFYPGTINIQWSCNKGKSPDTKKPEYTMNSDKLYDMKSEQRFPADLFKDPDFRVCVSWKHESMDKQESREFSVKYFPWPPQIEDIDTDKSSGSSTFTLSCKIHSFFPDLLTVKWIEKKTDGQEVDVTNNNKYTINNTMSKANDHTLSCNASLSFEKSHHSEDKVEYICRVEHPCLKSPIQSRPRLLQLEDLHSFIVHNIQGPQSWVVGEKVTLYCAASYCNKDVSVLWILKEGDGTTREVTELPPEKHGMIPSAEYTAVRDKTEKSDKEELDNITSSLSFVPSITKHRNLTLSCKLSSEGKTKEKSFQLKHLYAKPQFLEPAEFTICSPGEVQLGVNLRRFYPQTIDIQWSCNKGKSPDTKKPEYIMSHDSTYNTKSEQRFPADLFKDPDFRVCVSWKHESMDKEESREFSVKDFPWPPQIEDIDVEKPSGSRTVKLICKIHSFFPDLLTVKWIEKKTDGQEVDVTNNNKYTINNTTSKANDHTLSCNASLSFEKSHHSEDKVEYICRVEHPCLKSPIQSRTGLLQLEDLHSFIVHNIQGPQSWVVGEKVTLYCAASYCNKDVSVLWILKEGDGTTREVTELPPEKHGMIPSAEYTAVREKTEKSDKEELDNITSSLSFVPSINKHRNLTLSCKLSSEGKTKEKSFQLKHLYVKPKASDPIKLSLLGSGEVAGTFNIQEFYPKDIQIVWKGGVHPTSENLTSTEKITEHNYTHDVHSECRIGGHLFKHPDYTVKVSWKHESMDSWESRQISVRAKDYPWRPEIQNIPLPGIISNRPASLVCKISNFFPDNVTAKWLRKEKDSEELFPLNHGEKYKVPVLKPEKQSDNTFTCTASLNFTPSLETDQGAEFKCVVEHPSLGSAVEKKTGAVQVTEDRQKFNVNNIQGPQEWVDGEKVNLYCTASYCVKDVSVTWTIKEKDGRVYEISDTDTQQSGQRDYVASRESIEGTEKEDKCHVTSSLSLTPSVQKHLGLTIKCNIVCEGKPTEKQFKVQSIHAKPTLVEPVKRTLCDSGDVKYSLNLQNFYPKDLRITWTCGTGQTQKPVTSNEQVQENLLHTFNALSEVTVPGSHFKDPNFKVCVSWDHKTLKSPESREFSAKDPEFTWRPEIQEIPVSQVLSGKEATLQYNVSKYLPDAVTVKWLKKEKESPEFIPVNSDTKYKIPDLRHEKQRDHTYSCMAHLVFSPSVKSEDGAEFICRVEHPSLEGAIERRTKPIQVMAKPEISGPVKLSICETGEVLCVMNLRHFYPRDMVIQWFCGSNQIKPHEKHENNPDLTFNVVSECRVDENFFRNQDCNIRAAWKHISMENQEVREVSIRDPEVFPWRPVMTEISVPQLRVGEQVLVTCDIMKYYPDALTVTWIKRTQSGQESSCLPPYYTVSQGQSQRQNDHSFACQTLLSFTPSIDMDEGVELHCVAQHPSLRTPISRSTGVLKVTVSPKPRPIALTVTDNGEVQLCLELCSFYPNDIQIQWFLQSNNLQTTLPSEQYLINNPDLTWTAQSVCKLPHLTPVQVKCKHGDGYYDATWGAQDFPWRPKIEEITTPHIVIGRKVIIKCKILDCLPGALTVYWLAKEKGSGRLIPLSNNETYKMSQITWKKEKQNSFSVTSRLTFTSSLQTANILEFICRAEHAGCQPIEKGTGPINVTELAANHMRSEAENPNPLKVLSLKRSLEVDDYDYDLIAGSVSEKKVRADMTVEQDDDEMESLEENLTDEEVNDMDML